MTRGIWHIHDMGSQEIKKQFLIFTKNGEYSHIRIWAIIVVTINFN